MPQMALVHRLIGPVMIFGPVSCRLLLMLVPLVLRHAFVLCRFAQIARVYEPLFHNMLNIRLLLLLLCCLALHSVLLVFVPDQDLPRCLHHLLWMHLILNLLIC